VTAGRDAPPIDYGRPVEFGLNVVPDAADTDGVVARVRAADAAGLDLIGIQDHPYQRRFLDTMTLIGHLLAVTRRVRIAPDVASLPLRLPSMLAKEAATLDILSAGRFALGLGAGVFWDPIVGMGGPRRTPGESVDALEEGIDLIRQAWTRPLARLDGRHYQAAGYRPGPAPAHGIEIWLGAYKPRMLRLTGALADGWLPSLGYVTEEELDAGHRAIDEAAGEAGRDPRAIRRLLNIGLRSGQLTEAADGDRGTDDWVALLAGLATDHGVDSFLVSLPGGVGEVERFAGEVVPAARLEIERRRVARGTVVEALA
jgi:alkanesulfonate monooxygenase SsuD/methylene tetrahydromethanopterin reductase-like flavin-dependent oxidoreductase (luciferase family)